MNLHAPQVSEGVEIITPERAQEMLNLSGSFKNRIIRWPDVRLYASQMKSGRWRWYLYEPIHIDILNRVINGQHRLLAIIESGVSVAIKIVRGLPTEAVNCIDVGRERSRSDLLQMHGTKNANVSAAVLGWVYRYRTGALVNNQSWIPRPEFTEYYDATTGIEESVQVAKSMRRICRRASIMGGAHYIFSTLDEAGADAFMARVRDGEGLVAGDPEHTLRNRLIATERGRRDSDTMLSALVIKTWNARREGRRLKQLKWGADEAFPAAI